MAKIPSETIDQIVAATDIVELIGSYIPLKRAGSSYKANCPFHSEKTPSFNVSPQRQAYYCFGCGEGGGPISFVTKYENLPFSDAVKKLAERAGITFEEVADDPRTTRLRRRRGRLLELHRELTMFLHQLLKSSPEAAHARDYLTQRGVAMEVAEHWQLGWIPDETSVIANWAKQQGFKGRDLIDGGIAALRQENNPRAGLYLRFRDRLMFPIFNDYGDIIAFSGRVLQSGLKTGKYVNSPETILFDKSKTFFGLDKARREIMKAGHCLICEGQLDAIACVENGFGQAIAPLGTAFTEHHATLLKRYTNQVLLCFDSDAAGQKATERAFKELAKHELAVKVVKLPEGEDPDSLIRAEGVKAFAERVNGAVEFFDHKLKHTITSAELSDPVRKTEVTNELATLLAHIKTAVTRDTLIQHVATFLKVADEQLRDLVAKAMRDLNRVSGYQLKERQQSAEEKVEPLAIHPLVEELCGLALLDKSAQEFLYQQAETLHEALPAFPDIQILNRILERSPNPEKPAEIQSFIENQPTNAALTLQRIIQKPQYINPTSTCNELLGKLGQQSIKNQLTALKTQLHEVTDPNQANDLMLEIAQLQKSIHH